MDKIHFIGFTVCLFFKLLEIALQNLVQ